MRHPAPVRACTSLMHSLARSCERQEVYGGAWYRYMRSRYVGVPLQEPTPSFRRHRARAPAALFQKSSGTEACTYLVVCDVDLLNHDGGVFWIAPFLKA